MGNPMPFYNERLTIIISIIVIVIITVDVMVIVARHYWEVRKKLIIIIE